MGQLRKFSALVLAGVVSGPCFMARAADEPARWVDYIVAVVSDTPITHQQVELGVLQTIGGRQIPDDRTLSRLGNETFQAMLNQQLVLHEFKNLEKEGVRIPDSIIDEYVQDAIRAQGVDRVSFIKKLQSQGKTLEQFHDEIRDEFIMLQMRLKYVPEPIISPHKVQAFYDAHKSDFMLEDRIKRRQIYLARRDGDSSGAIRKRMEEIRSQITSPASFIEVGRTYTEGSIESDWVESKTVNQAILDGIKDLKPGQWSRVIETPEAYFIVLLEERDNAHVRPINDVREEIETTLRTQEQARARTAWIERLKTKIYNRSVAF